MKRRAPTLPRADTLARLITSSSVLDSNMKRYWLAVLDHLTPASRARLKAVLTAEDAGPVVGQGLLPRP